MIFARFVAIFFLSAATIAIAADKPSSSASTASAQPSSVAPALSQSPAMTEPELRMNGSGQPFWLYRIEPVIGAAQPSPPDRIASPPPRGRSLAALSDNVCYFIRTYRMKPTERVKDGESVSRGYSECEMASNYELRSAVAHENRPEKLK